MLDDLTKEIKAQLYERVKSPLFGAFAFSWVGWNYRALLGVVSELHFKERMAYLDGLYPTTEDWFNHCVWWPLLTAVLFLVIYPWPARAMYWYWAWQQKELKKVQQRIEDETPLTQEEARALRAVAFDQTREFESRLAGLQATNEELKARIGMLTEENARLDKERQQQAEAAKKADEQLTVARSDVLAPAANPSESDERASIQFRYSDAIDQLSIENAQVIRSLGSEASMGLIGLVACGGASNFEELAKILGVNPITIRHGLKALVARKLVKEATNGYYRLSDEGDSLVVRLGLTGVVPLQK